MKKKLIIVKSNQKLSDKTDWERLRKQSEEDIMTAALSDPDAQPCTLEELKQFKRVNPKQDIDVKKIRASFKLSQAEFAAYFGISKRTVEQWEQHRSKPSGLAANFLRVIAMYPEVVQRALR